MAKIVEQTKKLKLDLQMKLSFLRQNRFTLFWRKEKSA